jgi:2-methylcitrate dehydratase PrpD
MSDKTTAIDPVLEIERLAEAAAGLTFEQLPGDVVRLAKLCLLDWFGVAIAASQEPVVEALAQMSGTLPNGSTVLGRRESCDVPNALLINGTAGHLLDYDDVHTCIPGHVTVAIAPAVVSVGEALGSTGADMVTAFVTGFEAMCGIAGLLGEGHARAGFHPTATLGTFGAAVAVCHLHRAAPEQVRSAIANAATQAAGLRAAFGSPCKSIQVGRSSVNGHLSAQLALRGISAGLQAFGGRDGFVATHAGTTSASMQSSKGYFIRDVIFKFDASCFVTHAPIACIRSLRSTKKDMRLDTVRRIVVRVHPSARDICSIAHPTTALEAKFSIAHVLAMTLSGMSTQDIASFADTASFPALRPWREKVVLAYDPAMPAPRCSVSVEFDNGEIASASHDSEAVDLDMDRREHLLCAKFDALVSPVLDEGRTQALRAGLLELEHASDSHTLMSACRGH